MTTTGHSVCWMLPVRRDRLDALRVLCYLDYEAGCIAEAWMLWCPDCHAVVPGTELPGSAGMPSVDGLSDDAYELVAQHERRAANEHTARPSPRPAGPAHS
jgi:hypothetical protein